MTSNKVNSVDNLVLEGTLKTLEDSSSWRGTMTDLNNALVKVFHKSSSKLKTLPGSPSALRVVLNRIANRLRTRGVSVKFGRTTDHTRTRFVRLVK